MGDYTERRILDKCNEISRDVKRTDETQKTNQKVILSAFNRMADAIEGLTREVRGLREELSPKALDKPRLPTPDGGV
jgi:hypothetical protein